MSGIRTNAAAELLGVSPNTLRSWERRFGYPKPRRTQGGHRQYDLAELESLRRALLETHNISSAIELARQRGEGPSSPSRLLDAFDHFDEALADRIMEESLAVRSVERTVEEVLLPAIEQAESATAARPSASSRSAGHRLAARQPAGRRLRRAARRACSCSTRAPDSTSSRFTCRRSSWACGARASARCCSPSTSRPSASCAPSAHSTRSPSSSAAARPRSTWSAGSSTRSARSAPRRRCSSTARPCRSPGTTASRRSARCRSRRPSGSRATWTAAASSRSSSCRSPRRLRAAYQPRRPELSLGSELPAELREGPLLGLVEVPERRDHALGVSREEALDKRPADRLEIHDHDSAVLRRSPARHESARRQRPVTSVAFALLQPAGAGASSAPASRPRS